MSSAELSESPWIKSRGDYILIVTKEAESSLRLDSLLSLSKSSSPNSIAKLDFPSSDPMFDRESSSYSYVLIRCYQSSLRLLRILLPCGITFLNLLSYSYPVVPIAADGFIHFAIS